MYFNEIENGPARLQDLRYLRSAVLIVLIHTAVFHAIVLSFEQSGIHFTKTPVKVEPHDLRIAAAHHILQNVLRFGMGVELTCAENIIDAK